ncbi:MAG: hypothetical protein V1857_02600 [archaeon]
MLVTGTATGEHEEARYLKDRERLLETYDVLLNRIKELETVRAVLEERLRSSEAYQQELQQKLAAAVMLIKPPTESQVEIDSESVTELRALRSSIDHLLAPEPTTVDKTIVDVKELRSSITRLLSTGGATR